MSRLERRVRSRFLAFPFVATNALTRYEVFGREHLLAAVERHRRGGRGLITISNHQSLFDDPMVLAALLGLRDLNVENKSWWSTPCQTNFSPAGDSLRDRFVRYFSEVSNMVFFARRGKHGHSAPPPRYLDALSGPDREELLERIGRRAADLGLDGESWLRRFVTLGAGPDLAALNQLGMVEACARLELGDWLHFFPEATRSRSLELGAARRGVGKVLYHSPQAEVLPLCFCGMHGVLPVGAILPRPFRRVVVFIGEPVAAGKLAALRRGTATRERFQDLSALAWEPIQSLWPLALARYRRQRQLVAPIRSTPAPAPRAAVQPVATVVWAPPRRPEERTATAPTHH